jgi:hypothetical protein
LNHLRKKSLALRKKLLNQLRVKPNLKKYKFKRRLYRPKTVAQKKRLNPRNNRETNLPLHRSKRKFLQAQKRASMTTGVTSHQKKLT